MVKGFLVLGVTCLLRKATSTMIAPASTKMIVSEQKQSTFQKAWIVCSASCSLRVQGSGFRYQG
jgi:hypothetical protein